MRPRAMTGNVERPGLHLVPLVAATLLCLLAAASPAAAQISGASASTAGSTGNAEDSSGSRRSSVGIQTNDGSTLKTRFAWNISSDVGVASTNDTNGSAQHNVSFTVTAPGSYRLDLSTQRVGMLQRNSDVSGCDGQAHTSGITGSSNVALSSGTLSLGSPGDVGNGGGDNQIPFNQSTTATIFRASNGSGQGHSLTFTWNGSVRSNSCEAAVRQGEGSGVSGCDACVYPGTPSRTQGNDGHFVTVTMTSLCGNGVVDTAQGEQCDVGIAGSVCCNSSCHFQSSSTTCRAAVDVCDVAETCTGTSATCPANGFKASTVECRAVAGVCDVAENCTGSSASCPPDAMKSSATVCRPSVDVCDVAEHCTGTIPVCPADGFASPATVCRGAVDVCDLAENCTGSSAACPADAFKSSSSICRGAAGDCDVAENCTGSSASCPADVKSTAVCRSSSDACDAAESCDGVSDDCPPDLPAPPTTECRGPAGVCDVAEFCDGGSFACPPDVKSTAVCRAAVDTCDVAESCDGAGNDCPADHLQTSGVECRAVAGDCDVAETCNGSSAACPVDAFKPSTTVCRAAAGDCDVAENCTGSSASCPADGFVPDGTTCNDANACTLSDMCVAGACIGDSMHCGDGVVQSGCGEECDDGNVDSGDGCSATCQSEPGLGCPTSPLVGCRHPFVHGKASIQIARKPPSNDQLKWKWVKGERTTLVEYGDPLNTTNYQACIYDQSGLRMALAIPAGGTCAGKPCWKQTGFTGFVYKDKDLTPDGVQKLQLKEGALGKAQIQLLGRGANLGVPDLSTLTQPLTVQIQNSNGLCWEAVYSAPAATQTSVKFSDKAD